MRVYKKEKQMITGRIVLEFNEDSVIPNVTIEGDIHYKAWKQIPRAITLAQKKRMAEIRFASRQEREEKARIANLSTVVEDEEVPDTPVDTETVSASPDGHVNLANPEPTGPHNPLAGIAPEEKKDNIEATLNLEGDIEDEANAGTDNADAEGSGSFEGVEESNEGQQASRTN